MKRKITKDNYKNICIRYANDNVSMIEIAREYGCSSSTISKIIQKSILLRID